MSRKPAVISVVVIVFFIMFLLIIRACHGKKMETVPPATSDMSESFRGSVGKGQHKSGSHTSGTMNPTGTGLGSSGVFGAKNAGSKTNTGTKQMASSAMPPVPTTPTPPAILTPPPVQLHKELIPKDIEIVRVYYENMITGPASSIEFDINGSGFTQEFEKMIKVESGQPEAKVTNLRLTTPNQIHGTLVISSMSVTMVAFPKVLIGGKPVFQAPEPFAVIRPGEVLNLIFTDMGDSGRTGRFRVFTNLNQDMFDHFRVSVTTPAIEVVDMVPTYPFIVDGTIVIGPAVGGDYGIVITLAEKTIWRKDGIIRVVKPNVGQSGLVQRVQAIDGFQRPGDRVAFEVQGSGFQPQDASVLQATVNGLDIMGSSFTYKAPGRMELIITLSTSTPENSYDLTLRSGNETLQQIKNAFRVVNKNWTRRLLVSPDLKPGGSSTVTLQGRDMSPEFVSAFKVEVDEPALSVGAFKWVSPQEATASISAGAEVKPGDYLLHITSNGAAVNPQAGSLIRITPSK